MVLKSAELLAIKLSRVLAPFFVKRAKDFQEDQSRTFASWDETWDEWKERKSYFVTMFQRALLAKADSLLTTGNYEAVVEIPGTPYNPQTMTAETLNGEKISAPISNDANKLTVEICVEAGLYSHPWKALIDDGPVEDAIIPIKNFIRTSREQRFPLKPLIKAVVALQTDQLGNI